MSGFVGIVQPDGAPVEPSLLRHLTDSMSYCGPDHQGTWLDGHVGLGHALLGATPGPPHREHQPCTLDGRTWIATDARIDGRDELSAGLRGHGRDVPVDATDAAVILHAYGVWGEHCVEHLIGDFAFAIWDVANRSLFCARDHFGVVPFYYALPPGAIVVGNVLRGLRLHPGISDTLDERVIGDYLALGLNMDTSATFFADIRSLPPAHSLTFADGVTSTHRYWDGPGARDELRLAGPGEYVERFRDLFDRAVTDRLRSNQVGTHLTGGMDSTSIAATAKGILAERGSDFDLRAYTVVYDRLAAENEGRYADIVAARIGVNVDHVTGDEYMRRSPERGADWVFPEPAVTPGQSAEYEIGRRVATFSRSLLTGLGGDPLFHYAERWPTSPAQWRDRARFARVALANGRLPRYGIRTAVRNAARSNPLPEPSLPDWIAPAFARRIDLRARRREVLSEWTGDVEHRAMTHPKWASVFGWTHPGAHGLPYRVLFPFFDLRLTQFVWTVPRYPWYPEKRLLREAMRDRLPDAVLRRPKTLLYKPTKRTLTRDPRYRLALLPETRRWRTGLVADGAVCEYLDAVRVRALIDSPAPSRATPLFDNAIALVHWMQANSDAMQHHPTSEERHDAVITTAR